MEVQKNYERQIALGETMLCAKAANLKMKLQKEELQFPI
jgi:hypothetical protein